METRPPYHLPHCELLSLNRDVADHVIVHELLHFSVLNHGRLWKSLMRAHLGDYEKQEEQLSLGCGRNPGMGKVSRPQAR
jgi:hypothetical protein